MEPRKRSGTRRNTQRESSLRTHSYQPQRFFFPAIHSNAPPLRAKKFTVRGVEASHGEAYCENKCNFLGSNSDRLGLFARVPMWTVTRFHFVPISVEVSFAPEFCSFADSCQLRRSSFSYPQTSSLQQRPLMVKSWASASACGAGTSVLQPEGFRF